MSTNNPFPEFDTILSYKLSEEKVVGDHKLDGTTLVGKKNK
jgi:hypothetical protein